jgi:hypothetical protein
LPKTSWTAPAISSGDGDARRVQLVAVRIALAHEVAHDLDAGGADRDVGRGCAPRPPKRVRDDDSDLGPRPLAQGLSQPGGRGIRIDREQDDGLRLRRVRRVDAR